MASSLESTLTNEAIDHRLYQLPIAAYWHICQGSTHAGGQQMFIRLIARCKSAVFINGGGLLKDNKVYSQALYPGGGQISAAGGGIKSLINCQNLRRNWHWNFYHMTSESSKGHFRKSRRYNPANSKVDIDGLLKQTLTQPYRFWVRH